MTDAFQPATIFALATPTGRGAIAVVRLSGRQAGLTLQQVTRHALPPSRRAVLRRLCGPDGEMLDEALVLWMPGPASFTGEDCAELHLHGGPAIISGVLELLVDLGLRPAGPGEFTRRAFENGQLDLSQAEAVGDLVEAESGAQRRQALAQLGGALSRRYEAWRETLLDALSLLEAQIDFPDEDVPEEVAAAAFAPLDRVYAQIRAAAGETRGERIREGFRIALVGAPNVGKSSLLNALVERDAAIVTEIAGTTRDVVEAHMSLGGQAIVLADTAGLRDATDVIEAEGVKRARAWASSADIRVGVVDSSRPETLWAASQQLRAGDILVLNKADLAPLPWADPALDAITQVHTVATPAGVLGLRSLLETCVGRDDLRGEFPAATRLRHRVLLDDAAGHLQRGLESVSRGVELAAEDVRLALASLEKVTGRVNPEAVLDRVFASFCIGK